LLKDSVTRKIIVYSGADLCYPETALHEIRKYEKEIIRRAGITRDDYKKIFSKLWEYIEIVPEERLLEKLQEAKKIMLPIDPNDALFIAAALRIGADIGSNDKDFKKQRKIRIWQTKDLIKLFLKRG
jgi:predicted nucleic acid-binding protein